MKNFLSSILISLCISLAGSLNLLAQNPHNLVPNPSFEEVDGKIKGSGKISLAQPWKSVTMNPVDLYSSDAKDKDFRVPENKYGKEKARTGNNYAGVSFYGHRGRLPRTYLGVELKSEMIAGKEYCLKFHISMSDMSKYAVNNFGLYISKEELTETTDGNLSYKPQIMSITNDIYEQQYLWKDICGTYKAEGGEKFITIGNFFPDDETKQETVRLSREFSGRQSYDAYYYLDDVSVIATEKLKEGECSCDEIAGGQMKVEYKSFSADENDQSKKGNLKIINSDGSKAGEIKNEADGKPENTEKEKAVKKEKTVEDIIVYFPNKVFEIDAKEEPKIDKVVKFLKSNPKQKLEIVGHADPSELEVNFIGKRRAFAIKKALLDAGIPQSQFTYRSEESNQIVSDSDPSENQRVTFSLK